MRCKRWLAISIPVTGLVILVLLGLHYNASLTQASPLDQGTLDVQRDLLQASGHIILLRVHDLGTGFGPSSDFLDAEVVMRLDSQVGMSFGFQLRNDDFRPAREGMLNLLRDAFNHDWIVTADYWLEPGKTNGEILRVWLTKPVILEEN